ncbi:MAG: GNAT family N-acetyltransferase [Candidatus Heimdallarchaeota archaeon]
MPKKATDFTITSPSEEDAYQWADIFLEAMQNCKWMSGHLKSRNITRFDVALSFLEDLTSKQKSGEQFFIATYRDEPAGIIRIYDYWTPGAIKILSHFPLVIPKFQQKGIGKALVKRCIDWAYKNKYKEIWAEIWSKDQKEIAAYEDFFEKLGFVGKSDRLELNCQLAKLKINTISLEDDLILEKTQGISEEIIEVISKAYAVSNDKLHKIEKLGDPEIARKFLTKVQTSFAEAAYTVESSVIRKNGILCAGMVSGVLGKRGMIMEVGVNPDFRGQKIGQRFISNYLSQMKSEGIEEVALGVDKDNTPAVKLYQKLGFKKSWLGSIMLFENKDKLL